MLGVMRTDAYSYNLAGRLTAVTRDGVPLVS
jgi:YD repeat-containing protein